MADAPSRRCSETLTSGTFWLREHFRSLHQRTTSHFILYHCFLKDWLEVQSLTLPFTEDSGPLVLWAELLLDTSTGPGLWPREGTVFRVFTNLATSLLFSPVTPGRFTVTKLAMLTAGGEGKEGATLTKWNHLLPTHSPCCSASPQPKSHLVWDSRSGWTGPEAVQLAAPVRLAVWQWEWWKCWEWTWSAGTVTVGQCFGWWE